MKKNIILVILMTVILSINNACAAPVGSSFSYQGQLLDNNNLANGNYDIIIEAYSTKVGNGNLGVSQTFNAVTVSEGIFNIPQVDFGDAIYTGDEIWLNIQVRKTGNPTYITLSPRQRLNAVPYAVQTEFLAPNGANTNDFLQFDGSNWVGGALNIPMPWDVNGSDISYSAGKVGIGTGASAITSTLEIKGESGVDPFRIQNSTTGIGLDFRVAQNGGVAIGPFTPNPPLSGLQVQGNVRQGLNTNGIIKYMVDAFCDPTPTIHKFYNGVDNGIGAVTIDYISTGRCKLVFPFSLNDRYYQVSSSGSGPGVDSRGVSCTNVFDALYCKRYNGVGTAVNGRMMILIY